jgi:hypothetical protein
MIERPFSQELRSWGQDLTRIAVILHERIGNWARQLRPRLHDLPIRWFETRSVADLEPVLTGMACPVAVLDLGSRPAAGLLGLQTILHRASDARALVLDPEVHDEAAGVARELGATYVMTGFVPPPVVASLVRRWIKLAQTQVDKSGWSKVLVPDPESEPWSWLAPYLADPASASMTQKDLR